MAREIKQSFWTQKNNDGKYGFFPTSLDVVRMEMDLIDFSSISNDMPISICDFTGGTGEQLLEIYNYIKERCCTPVAYYNELTRERYEIANERYGHLEGFNLMNTDLFYLKCRHKVGNAYKADNIAIIRNNPPYVWVEMHGENVRAEDLFFCENAKYNIPGGIQIFELPIHQLVEQQNLIKKIFYRYENVSMFKFPEEEFDKYKQIVVIGVRKKQNSNDVELAEHWREKLKKHEIPYLNEVQQPLYVLNDTVLKRCREINVFRDGRVNDITLSRGLDVVLDGLLEKESDKDQLNRKLKRLDDMPVIERLIGHRAVELNAGKFNGILGNVLVEGGSQKKVVINVEEDGDKKVTEEIEVISPYIEITNKNGDIIFKDS